MERRASCNISRMVLYELLYWGSNCTQVGGDDGERKERCNGVTEDNGREGRGGELAVSRDLPVEDDDKVVKIISGKERFARKFV